MSTQDGKTSNMPQVFTIGPDDLVEMVHEGKNVHIVGSDFLASIADQIEVTPGGEGGISVKGPFRLFEQERGNYRITNFDSQQNYEVSAEIGKVSILDDNSNTKHLQSHRKPVLSSTVKHSSSMLFLLTSKNQASSPYLTAIQTLSIRQF